ncbi:hypothetical protein AB0I30_32665 [Nocardia tengchongensis]|uniref:hypothetical protein n=1 Tax=Nocardia tengchongensis TaxID=2055889 RepID=UPI00340F9E2D
MTTRTRLGRRIGWGIAGLAAIMAVGAVGASTASADVHTLAIYPTGQTYYVGASYGLVATTVSTGGLRWVTLYDNGQCLGGMWTKPVENVDSVSLVAKVNWVPSTVGHHVLTADDSRTTQTFAVDVLAAPAGTVPATPAQPSGCSPLERFLNSGSAG